MKRFHSRLLDEIRTILKGHEAWHGERVKPHTFAGGVWRIHCGEGRFDPSRRNAAYAKRTSVALNFQISGHNDACSAYEICLAWPAQNSQRGWQLMFHFDPERGIWPDHPELHLQMSPSQTGEPPPFASWRVPLGCTKPQQLLEFVQWQVA